MRDQSKAVRRTTANLSSGLALGYWADELRHHREAKGFSQGQLARLINYSESQVAMVETCKRAPKPGFIRSCDDVLGTGGALARLWKRIIQHSYLDWFRPFVELEAEATEILEYEVQAVPGLLQTEEYARAVLRAGRPRDTDEQIEQHVAARLDRQAILTRKEPPLLWVVMDESVLRRPVGGREAMRWQLARLVEASRSAHTVLQVLPIDVGAHAGMAGARTILTLPDQGDLLYVETPGNGQIIGRSEEVADWALRFDLIRATALSPAESVRMITEMIGEG